MAAVRPTHHTHCDLTHTIMQQQYDFLTNGYVALTVTPGNAFTLFNIYTHSQDCRRINIRCCQTDGSYRILRPDGQWSAPLCYVPNPRGTVVPQAIWQPAQAGDVQRHVNDAELLWPIFFLYPRNVVGIRLSQAVNSGAGNDLVKGNAPVRMGSLSTTHLCLRVS